MPDAGAGGPSTRDEAGVAWSEAALRLFRLTGPSAVSAGAGAGKTTALVELLLRLIAGETPLGPCRPEEIVAITFTERAGAELAERLGEALARASAAVRPEGAERLAAARRGLPRMAVGTIHGFAARLLREHALDAGVDPDFAVLEEEAAAEALDAAALAAAIEALRAGGESIRALAAGHGGVRGLAEVAAALVRDRAVRGLSGPVAAAGGDPAGLATAVAELASAGEDLLRLRGRAATPSGQAAMEELARGWPEARARLAAGSVAGLCELAGPLRRWRLGRAPPEVREARERFLALAAAIPAVAAEISAAPQARSLADVVLDAERRYRDGKRAAGALDFDDLLLGARDLLRDEPLVRRELRRRTRALLVDEYQDVNRLQAEIFELLSGDPSPPDGEDRPAVLVAVGDAKQSIYRFRGADVAVFAGVIEELGPGGRGQVLHLRENHRSVPGVIDLVNHLLEASGARLGVPFGEEDRLRAMRGGGAFPAAEMILAPELGPAEERRAREASALAARIRELIGGGAGVTVRDRASGLDRPPRLGEVAVLFRRLTHVREYERALRQAGVPCRLGRGGGFFQAPEVRDLGELLASLADPSDELAWAALLRSPLCGLSDGSLFLLARGGGGRSGLARLWRLGAEGAAAELRSLRPGGPAEGEGERLARFLEAWGALARVRDRLDVGELLAGAVDALDLEAALLAGPDGERRARNVRKALDLARGAAARGAAAAAFGASLRRMARRPAREPEASLEEADAVALLSVHQAKGLEWPVVAVPDLTARLPGERRRAALDEAGRVCAAHYLLASESFEETASLERLRRSGAEAEAAESRRLLYVALTRAKDYLVLSSAGPAPKDSWAALLGEVPERLLARLEPGEPREAAGGEPDRSGSPGGEPAAGVAPPPIRRALAEPVREVVTALSEYGRCPRRHWFSRHLRLPEPRPERPADDPDRATERGSLAHALLAEVDLLAPPLARRALVAAAASRRGYDPAAPGVRAVLADVERFLHSELGRRLAEWERSGALRREVPFLLRLGGGAAPCYLDGAIDALVVERREVRVLDFKYARRRREEGERYRLQLLAYALAASRAWPEKTVRSALWFLRGGAAALDLTPSQQELLRFAAEVPGLARGAASASGRGASPESLGRDEERCRGEGCGYAARCFARTGAEAGPGIPVSAKGLE